jgi:hypothetical protein
VGPIYSEDPVIPFAIDLDTLPRYPLLPTLLVHPDDIDCHEGRSRSSTGPGRRRTRPGRQPSSAIAR